MRPPSMATTFVPPLEEYLPLEKRDAIRNRVLARIPGWYNPYLHLAIPSAFGLGVIAVAIAMLRDVAWWQLLIVPAVWIFNNINEWRIHRDILHRRFPLAPVLYDRHTPEHHMIYV